MQTKASPAKTRDRLLAAAEKIIVEQGMTGVSVRKVGQAASINPTLVTYHFKSIEKMLGELCDLNLNPILDDWRAVDPSKPLEGGLDAILKTWIEPMLRPAAFTPGGRALVVLDEMAVHGKTEIRSKVMVAMGEFTLRLRAALAPHCPNLGVDELRARVRFISGSVLGPPPRSSGATTGTGDAFIDDLNYLIRFARAGLTG